MNFYPLAKLKQAMTTGLLAILIISQPLSSRADDGSEFYHPAPIIMIHGIGSSFSRTWNDLYGKLRPYFFDFQSGQFKYFHSSFNQALPIVNYSTSSNEGVLVATGFVESIVDEALAAFPSGSPTEERKVTIIAHSLGALATRYLLQIRPDLRDKLKKTILIGGPHFGSPLASWVALIEKESKANGTIDQLLNSDERFLHTFTDGQARPADRAYLQLLTKLVNLKRFDQMTLRGLELVLALAKLDIDTTGQSMLDLRVPAEIETGFDVFAVGDPINPIIRFIDVAIASTSHSSTETFLGNTSIYSPSNVNLLVGEGGGALGSFLSFLHSTWNASNFFIPGADRHAPEFPAGHGINDLSGGDGIVTELSQKAILGSITVIPRNHLNETQAVNEILSLIDDAPVIKRLRIAEAPPFKNAPLQNYYLIFEVEEYLPADLEVSEFTLDSVSFPGNSDLATFLNSEGKYIPYHRFRHDMLKRRLFEVGDDIIMDYNNEPIELAPREFPIEISAIGEGAHSVTITFKNAAKKATSLSFQFSRPTVTKLRYEPNAVIKVGMPPGSGNHPGGPPLPGEDRASISFLLSDPLFQNVGLSVDVYILRTWDDPRTFLFDFDRFAFEGLPVRDLFPATSEPDARGVVSLSGSHFFSRFVTFYGKDNDGAYLNWGYYRPDIRAIGFENGSPAIDFRNPTSGLRLGVEGSILDLGTLGTDKYPDIIIFDPTFLQAPKSVEFPVSRQRPALNEASISKLDKFAYLRSLGITDTNLAQAKAQDKIRSLENAVALLDSSVDKGVSLCRLRQTKGGGMTPIAMRLDL